MREAIHAALHHHYLRRVGSHRPARRGAKRGAEQLVPQTLPQRQIERKPGAGAFARGLLAHGARRVVAVESFPASVDALARLSPLVRAIGGRVEDVLDDALAQGPRAAVVDPPRKGLGLVAKRLGAATTLKRVALVSCDVDTGAHDAKALVDAGFVVDAIIPVDLFRGSAEVEVLTLLSRR